MRADSYTFARYTIQVGGKLSLLLIACASIACGAENPSGSSHVRPASPADVAPLPPPPDVPADVSQDEQAPSRSLYATGPRTIGGGTPEASRPRYVGRKIDLDVKGADIHEVCRLLADVGKVNIVVADDVTGSITIKMRQVPWDQALETILRAKGYRAEREGSIILVVR